MGNIVLLDELTINKIAAGEVIERPASVVKELVENSIDAGAKNITVEIQNGGISLIKVTDDGCGMAEDDMEIAFERHATSKIRNASDLETVQTMGFRGEALASVAAIANVEMVSKRKEDDEAHRIVVKAGDVIEKSETGASNGTTITVTDLFFNTPVRYKFLKKDFTEAGYIEDAVTRIALINKDVSIKLINTGKTVIQTNGNGDFRSVIYSIYGKDIAEGIIDVDYTYEDMKITGVVGKPEISRNTRVYQQFFVNNRYIKDKNLSAACDQAYKGVIPGGKHGFVILNLDMDPSKVDVNVHPTKLEVRFEEEGKVFKAVYYAIKSGLAKAENIADIENPIEIGRNKDESTSKVEENEHKDEKSKPVTGLFKKMLKSDEETEEEMENNNLRDVFEYRQNAKRSIFGEGKFIDLENENENESDNKDKNDLDDVESVANNFKEFENSLKNENENNETNENDLDKTRKVDLNDHLKDKTLILDSTKGITDVNKDDTEIVDTIKVDENENINSDDLNDKEEPNLNDKPIDENVSSDQEEDITQKLVNMKLENDLDDTQFVDSKEVRNSIKNKAPMTPEFANMYKEVFGTDVQEIRKTKEEEEEKIDASSTLQYAEQENENVFENEETYVPELKYKFIGIVFDTYIIISINDEMYLIDQHAAHERIMYEKVKKNYYSEDDKDSQMLLLADVISLSHKEMEIARENEDMFKKAGFEFEEFGTNTIKLTAVPSMCEELNTKKLFLELLDEMDTVAVTARQEKEDKFIATVACKAAVKGKMKLDKKEVDSLMDELLSLPNPFSCPHGRPTAVKITKTDLEKKFSRR